MLKEMKKNYLPTPNGGGGVGWGAGGGGEEGGGGPSLEIRKNSLQSIG